MSRRGNAVSAIFVVALLVLSYYALRGVIRALGPCVCVCVCVDRGCVQSVTAEPDR